MPDELFDEFGAPTAVLMTKAWTDYDARKPPFVILDWGVDRFTGEAPDIEWLVEGVLPTRTPGMLCSLGGVGKSFLMLDLCVRLATKPGMAPSFALGGQIKRRGRVAMITAEDSANALHRRMDQIMRESEKEKLRDWLYLVPLADHEGEKSLLANRGGEYVMTAVWDSLVEQVIELSEVAGGIDLLVLDPLQAMVMADINSDPAAAAAFWSAISGLCARAKCSVLVTHHMNKASIGGVDGPMGARESIRGTTSLVDSARWVFALWLPTREEREAAEAALGESIDPLGMVFGAVVKSNDIGMTEQRVFLRDPVSGLVMDATEQVGEAIDANKRLSSEQIGTVFDEVDRRVIREDPFSGHPAGRDRYLGNFLVREFRIDKKAAHQYVRDWLTRGFLERYPHPQIQRAQGVRSTSDVRMK